uniref:Head decoration protein n=1 Tax=Mycena chlorophos TaxID=658473 RepID=A0ABQ0KXQ7_MYCCL|nr:predicted protein [Mycena chlorophos]
MRHDGGFIVSQANGHLSIDPINVNSGNGKLQAGTLLASTATTYAGTATAGSGNTGNGTFAGIAVEAPALAGNYTVNMISPTEFEVLDPNGEPVPMTGGTTDVSTGEVVTGPGTVGEVFNGGGVGFLISAGSTAFVVGDTWTLAVTETGGGWAPVTSSTSSPIKYAILYGFVDTTNNSQPASGFVRDGEVNLSELIFDPSLSAAQQNSAVAALAGQGVIAR